MLEYPFREKKIVALFPYQYHKTNTKTNALLKTKFYQDIV